MVSRRWVGWPGRADAALPGAEGAATGPLAPNAFVRVGSDNIVTVVCKHHEMGQGNTTGLASLVADELDADWALVRTEYAPSDAKLYNNLTFGELQGTGGSSAIANSFVQCATPAPRRARCSSRPPPRQWKVPAGEIRTAEERAHARLGPARELRRDGRRRQAGRRRRRHRR